MTKTNKRLKYLSEIEYLPFMVKQLAYLSNQKRKTRKSTPRNSTE